MYLILDADRLAIDDAVALERLGAVEPPTENEQGHQHDEYGPEPPRLQTHHLASLANLCALPIVPTLPAVRAGSPMLRRWLATELRTGPKLPFEFCSDKGDAQGERGIAATTAMAKMMGPNACSQVGAYKSGSVKLERLALPPRRRQRHQLLAGPSAQSPELLLLGHGQ